MNFFTMDPNTVEYEEYYAEDHQVDEFPPGQDVEESPDGVSGFFDSLNTIKTGITDSLHMPEEDQPVQGGQPETTEGEDKGIFESITGFGLPSPFSHGEENGEEKIELIQQENHGEKQGEKKQKSSLLNKLTTRFDAKKEEGYDVKSSTTADDTELKDAPKVSNMVKMFENFQGANKDDAKASESNRLAEEEIAAEKRKAAEKNENKEKPGLFRKLSKFSLTGGKHQEEVPPPPEADPEPQPEESKGLIDSFIDTITGTEETKPAQEEQEAYVPEEKPEHKRGLMDRLAASLSFDAGDVPLPAEPEQTHEVDEAASAEPSILDQIVHTFTGEPDEQPKTVEYYD